MACDCRCDRLHPGIVIRHAQNPSSNHFAGNGRIGACVRDLKSPAFLAVARCVRAPWSATPPIGPAAKSRSGEPLPPVSPVTSLGPEEGFSIYRAAEPLPLRRWPGKKKPYMRIEFFESKSPTYTADFSGSLATAVYKK